MASENEKPAPKLDPEDLALRTRPRPVKRINRRVLALLTGTGLILIAIVFFVALDPPELFDRSDTGRELYRTENNPTPEGLDQLPSRYSDLEQRIELGPPLPGDLGSGIAQAERDLGIEATPNLPFRPDPEADAVRAERIRQARLAQQGRESDVFFQLTTRSTGLLDPTSAAADRSATVQDAQVFQPGSAVSRIFATTGPSDGRSFTDQNGQAAKQAFLNADVDDEIYSKNTLQDPISPY